MNDRPISVTVSRRFNAPAERVFDAWLDPALARRWLFTTPETSVTHCTIDATVGGQFEIIDHRDDGDIRHVGEYLAIDRPHKLVFTFGVPQFSPLFDVVTVTIRPLEEGCELTLENAMAQDNAEWAEPTREGWTKILAALADALDQGGRDGRA
jgi:uncharacterized protein YndB with AHSA1/START domain